MKKIKLLTGIIALSFLVACGSGESLQEREKRYKEETAKELPVKAKK